MHRPTERLRHSHRTIECSPQPSEPYHHITEVPFIAVLLHSTSCLAVKKNYKAYQKEKYPQQFEDTKQASEPDRAGMLELSDGEFKATMIDMLRAVKDRVNSMQEQMGNISRVMKILRMNSREILEMENIVIHMKFFFDGLISRTWWRKEFLNLRISQ